VNCLIIATNQCRDPLPVMPVGACIVADAAERVGHRVSFLDLMFEREPMATLSRRIDIFKPDIVGFSIRNIDNNDMRNPRALYEGLKPLAAVVRENTVAPLIIGGPALGVMPEALLRYTNADWAVTGDGEAVFPALLDAIASGRSPRNISGVARLEDDRYFASPPLRIPPSNDSILPQFSKWLDVKTYTKNFSAVPFQSKRGCPYKCVYCTYAGHEGNEYCLRPPAEVAEAVKTIEQQGLRDVEFVDNVFNAPYEHAMSICEELIRLGNKARLQTVELNPRFVTDELLTNMERAGFVGVGISAESADGNVLEKLGKGYTEDDVHRAVECIKNHKIPCLWLFLLGGPGETETSVRKTITFAEQQIGKRDAVFFNMGIRVYPGTEIEEIACSDGVLDVPPDEMLKPVFYLSPSVKREWMQKEIDEAVAHNVNFMKSSAFSHPWLSRLQRAAYSFGFAQPLWRHTTTARRIFRFLGKDI
jgi:radical SAM superfamily enzyme YgiQ (UPF0313 family)